MSIIKQMEILIDVLIKASKDYYNGNETMSDKEYDTLYDKLERMERDSNIVLPNSPTVNVGYESGTPLVKVMHEYPSLSLNKTKDRDILGEWLGNHEGVLSWKCDGLTIILTYDNGKLVRAATRGNGNIGEDVTRNAVNFANVPLRINDRRHIVIRGEAVMPYAAFESINDTLPPDKRYRNPRNMAAGAAKVLDPKKTATYGVRFIPFDVANAMELGITKLSQALAFVKSLGLEPVEWTIVDVNSILQIVDQKEKLVKTLPYPTDGLVIAYDDLNIHQDLGSTSKYPRYAIALKWQDELKTTILRGVDWSVAKSGLISPVAIFDPIELEGSTVRRAGLHNITIAKELGLGIGDRIRVYKANMIIPQIYDDLDKTNNIDIPTKCPICGHVVEQRIGVNNKSVFLHCPNEACPVKLQ